MPKLYLSANDYVLRDEAFVALGFYSTDEKGGSVAAGQPLSGSRVTVTGRDGRPVEVDQTMGYLVNPNTRMSLDVNRALDVLKADPDLGARFLGRTGGADGNGTIYWEGAYSTLQTERGSLGIRVMQRRDGDEVVGDNLYGAFLSEVRDAYREYLRTAVVNEVPVEESQVVTDFTRKGAYESDIEAREKDGERFLHTDVYKPVRPRFDASLNGTTGHAGRASDEGVSFQRFDCPFGTGYPSPLVVGSAAEASMLYERALRGEVHWPTLIRNLSERGLLRKDLSERQKETMAREYTAQFNWMREQIATDPSLRDRPVVAASHLVSDESLGRSIYDGEFAPSPAHVLAFYVNNPVLLYAGSRDYVVTALQTPAKGDPQRFWVDPAKTERLDVLVVGSDTIGGREPGGKGYSDIVREVSRDGDGKRVVTASKQYRIPKKADAEIERDYEAFRTRMDEVLGNIPEGVQVRLVTGSSSTMGDTVGVGTPRMVERYVREKGGRSFDWDFVKSVPALSEKDAKKGEAANPDLSAVLMDHFADCYPVLVGAAEKVDFLLDRNDTDSDVSFSAAKGIVGGAAVCFSVRDDAYNRNVLSMGSLAVESGLPVVHVQENRSEEVQREMLLSGAVLSRSAFSGERDVEGPALLTDGEGQRSSWDLSRANVLSFVDKATGYAVPFVSEVFPAGVSVGGYSFRSAYSAYAALLAQELGKGDDATMGAIRAAERSTADISRAVEGFTAGQAVPAEVQERCLRRSVRLMAEANGAFADRLLEIDGREVVMPSSAGPDGLFTNLDGEGLNRFGIVLTAEGAAMRELREARRVQEEQERTKMLEDASRRQKVIDARAAEGEKIAGGFPQTVEGAAGAVWFIGTHTPDQFALPDDGRSFEMWDDLEGADRLVRAKAVAQRIDDGEGGKLDNTYVFLFPSDLASVTGRYRTSPRSDSTNLTDCMRVDPKTGEKFVCAFGVPVRFNNRGYEPNNRDMMPCSYRLDNDAANYARSLVLADSQARVQAIRHGMALCLPGRQRRNGEDHYTLGQVFMDKVWTKKDGWSDNPHKAPLNLDITQRYISMLERGRSYPLTMIPMPKAYYRPDDPEGARERAEKERGKGAAMHYVSAEGRFVADLNLSLRIANATALALGVPLRFPLDKDGRVDLGPGVPENFRLIAESTIDSFIHVVKERDYISGKLPLVERLDTDEGLRLRQSMEFRKGPGTSEVRLPANDLVPAFGPYDFDGISHGGVGPLHEMMFRMGEDYFYVYDSKLNRGFPDSDKYINYELNDERRMIIKSSNPDRCEEFAAVLREYVDRAKSVRVEMRLVQETEEAAKDLPMEGFVNMLDSNSESFVQSEHDIGRTATIYNAVGRVSKEGAVEDRNVNGEKTVGVYYGRTDSRDGFAGYAQFRYSYDGSPMSDWKTIEHLKLAKQVTNALVGRKYAYSDEFVAPSSKALDMFVRAEAVAHLVCDGTFLASGPAKRKAQKADSKVVVLEEKPAAPEEQGGKHELGTGAESPEQCWFLELTVEDKRRAFSFFYREDAAPGPFDAGLLKDMSEAVEASKGIADPVAAEAPLLKVYERFTEDQERRMYSDVSKSMEVVPDGPQAQREQDGPDIVYTRSKGGYQQRTRENANAEGVDFTLAFAVDFSTYGERATAKAAGDYYVPLDIPVLKDGGADLSQKAVDRLVSDVREYLSDDFFKGESCGLNIAGNGIYTLSSRGVTQEQADELVLKVLDGLQKNGMSISSIRSGGQTGIDEAGIAAAVALGVPATVHTTKDWAFRREDNVDVTGDEKAFKARFETKEYAALKAKVAPVPQARRKAGQKTGQAL